MSQAHLLYFDWEDKGVTKTYAIQASELSSVATLCPIGRFPGLPSGVWGLVLWSGKVLPVLDLSALLGDGFAPKLKDALAEGRALFLFSSGNMPGDFAEVALVLPAQLRAVNEQSPAEDVTILDLKNLCTAREQVLRGAA